ncbi:MAG: hypothetical protein KKD29_07150 [Candidatus Omnitrophica bacterium]|nr:hypothetical protein [Candidatus Omnitrophota bacterium]MBU4488253.1 hypothetical protein [Candidatus Omnitrophota bacterium]MCG2704701.1 hypothetical protein [Candidatus Omnitrophota bacterium]
MRNWQAYHNFEEKEKASLLRKMSEKDSTNILRQLYKFADGMKREPYFTQSDEDKIKSLIRVHRMFGKIKK